MYHPRRLRRLVPIVLGSFLLYGCSHFDRIALESLPTAAQYPDATAVVLDDDLEVRFGNDPLSGRLTVDETVRVRARILRDGGERIAEVVVSYDPMFDAIESFDARTITPDGKEKRFGWSDGVDGPQLGGFELYSDNRALHLRLTPQTPGTVIEYRYTRRYRDPRMATFAQSFESVYPERRVRLTVIAPSTWAIETAARRGDALVELDPEVTQSGGLTTHVWERHDVPALPAERFAPDGGQLATEVAVRPVRWTERGAEVRAPVDPRGWSAWLYTLTRPPQSTEAVSELARSLVRDLPPDPRARASRLYAWVRDHISYCAVEIGLGGWQPHGAGEVFRHRYGDCKDKANLLREMFAAVGGSSELVVLYAHDGMPAPFDLVTHRTNHAILRLHLPEGDLLADPTSPTTPFGVLPVNDQEAPYLPLSENGAALGRAPASSADDNSRELDLELAPKDGELVGRFHATVRGAPADLLRAELLQVRRDDQLKHVASALGLPRAWLSAWALERAAPPESATPLVAKGLVHVAHGWPSTPYRLVSAAQLVGSRVPALPGGSRRAPLVLRCRERFVDRVSLALDDSLEVTLPSPTTIERPFGRYELRWERSDGKLMVTRTLTLAEHIFPASAYADVKGFFDEILAADARALTIRRRAL